MSPFSNVFTFLPVEISNSWSFIQILHFFGNLYSQFRGQGHRFKILVLACATQIHNLEWSQDDPSWSAGRTLFLTPFLTMDLTGRCRKSCLFWSAPPRPMLTCLLSLLVSRKNFVLGTIFAHDLDHDPWRSWVEHTFALLCATDLGSGGQKHRLSRLTSKQRRASYNIPQLNKLN